MNPWKNETHTIYGCKETPYIRISIMNDNELIYRFALDSLDYYRYCHGKDYLEDYVEFYTPVINPKDYSMLVSEHHYKFILEIQQRWRNSETGEDELIELPSVIFDSMNIDYCNNYFNDEAATWRLRFYNRR